MVWDLWLEKGSVAEDWHSLRWVNVADLRPRLDERVSRSEQRRFLCAPRWYLWLLPGHDVKIVLADFEVKVLKKVFSTDAVIAIRRVSSVLIVLTFRRPNIDAPGSKHANTNVRNI